MFEARFQDFSESADPRQGKARARALRKELHARKLTGFIVPRADEHQSEYVPPSAERLAWLTGFTGSAGLAIVLEKKAAVFVDGRYTLQVRDQVDTKVFEPVAIAETSSAAWLAKYLRKGDVLGYDPWLTTPAGLKSWEEAARKAGARLEAVDSNPLDAVWMDRPAPPQGPVALYPEDLSGESAKAKIARIRDRLMDKDSVNADAILLSDPHDCCWAFNIRGTDVQHTPLALCFALVPRKGKPQLFIDQKKLGKQEARALSAFLTLEKPEALIPALRKLGRAKASVLFDAYTAPVRLVQVLEKAGGAAHVGADPVRAMKAVKNATELAGSRAAHLRDGAAMVRFLAWFDTEAAKGRLTEIQAVEALESFRRDTGALKEISFPTISGSGPNGAIVHYRVTVATNRRIAKGLFLLDSGAQYLDGTTDITRTIAVGAPSKDMKDRFTRVLKGHIAIARAVFPKGTSGAQIDAFARQALWEEGLDYAHGTGHGVGAFLSVHEGPQNISKRGSVALEEGMILSNEPGYYKTGEYGIRIENLVAVQKAEIPGAEGLFFSFETLTLCPIDLTLVDTAIMTREELRWLDAYHARVRKELSPLVDAETRKWLAQATRGLGRG
ncbi:MAG: aminopeptidase P family protein [Beijerinckiaceae bacterium]